MTKVAIAYSTKDRVELTKQTWPALTRSVNSRDYHGPYLFWVDGSATDEGKALPAELADGSVAIRPDVRGGADAAIVFALTNMLRHEEQFTHVGLLENDVLLHEGWFEAMMALFEKGEADGLEVGAVSPRCYADRILIQRDAYAVCHNLGAGAIILTREAAELVLKFYRTGWWSDNRAVFAQLSGIDIGRYAAFRGNEQWTSADWHWDAVLAQHGLASLALTPCMCDMIGQEPSLEEQGLELVRDLGSWGSESDESFLLFKDRTMEIREGTWRPSVINPIHEYMGTKTHFAHQIEGEYEGAWRLQWSQGFGGFAYRAGKDYCGLRLMVYGPVTFLVSGGKTGAKVHLIDTESGYEINPHLPAGEMQIAQLPVPGNVTYREIVLACDEGAVFYGIQTTQPQPTTNHTFDFNSLPPV